MRSHQNAKTRRPNKRSEAKTKEEKRGPRGLSVKTPSYGSQHPPNRDRSPCKRHGREKRKLRNKPQRKGKEKEDTEPERGRSAQERNRLTTPMSEGEQHESRKINTGTLGIDRPSK